MEIEATTFFTILGMALVTYVTRAGGLWLMSRISPSRRLEAGLRQIPGAVLTALIAPVALSHGAAEIFATLATILITARTKNVLLGMLTGVGFVFLLRNVLL